MNKLTEKKMENGLIKHYKKDNLCRVKNQVPFTQKRVDIVVKKENLIFAIEVKIHDWKGALRQASQNKVAFDESYVAIWHKFSHRALNNRHLFEKNGVGLIIINDDYSPTVGIPNICSSLNVRSNLAYSAIFNGI